MKHSLRSNLLVSFSTIIILLLLAEIGMRIGWEMSPNVRRPFYRRSSDPFIRYELIPGFESGRLKINSLGFRDSEYAREKPSGTFRILLIGDSEIFSYLLDQHERLDNKLEDLLNTRESKTNYEVINSGVEGYGTIQELELLRVKGLALDPDLVILNYCLNDPDEGEYHFSDNALVRNSALYRYIWYKVRKAQLKKRLKTLKLDTEVKFFHYLHSGDLWDNVQAAIIEMADILQAKGIPFIVNIFPTSSLAVSTFQEGYPYRDIHEQIKAIKHGHLLFVDPINEFNRLGLTPQDVSINYTYNESHKNPRALGIMAQYLVQKLRANQLLPE